MAEEERRESIQFVVGEEKSLTELLSEAEVAPLFQSLLRAGANGAAVLREDGERLWGRSASPSTAGEEIRLSLAVEGEPVGFVLLQGAKEQHGVLAALAGLFRDTLQSIVNTNLKRMLTTEIHTTVVNQSYEELLTANTQLAASEARYRQLAENLEKLVEERTSELQHAYARLIQQEKMAAVGQLAAGMAHEINNPLGFVTSNLNTLAKYVARFREMLLFCRSAAPGLPEEAQQRWHRLKLDAILADVDDLFGQSLEGCKRVGRIIADLKAFSHVDEGESVLVDVNQEIDRTVSVLASRLPEDCTIVRNYGELPRFRCHPAQLSQVFLNIIMNALQARPTGLALTIDTAQQGEFLLIRFTDNGPGIPTEVLPRIFDPFFTTREVGTGVGLGLATAYDRITAWGGSISAANQTGQGACFTLRLPVART